MNVSDERRHFAQSTSAGPPEWPNGVRPISNEGMGSLGVGDDGSLYWDGKPIVVQKTVTLTRLQTAGAFVVALASVVAAVATCFSAYADMASLHR